MEPKPIFCGIAHILGILLRNSYDTQICFLATTAICSLSTLNHRYSGHSNNFYISNRLSSFSKTVSVGV